MDAIDTSHPANDTASRSTIKPAKVWLAALLGAAMPGLGALYAGASLGLALAFTVIAVLAETTVAVTVPRLLSWEQALLAVVSANLATTLIWAFVAVTIARSAASRRLPPPLLQYAAFLCLAFAVVSGLAFFETHLPVQAFKHYHISTESMMPTILPGDRISADLNAYKHAAPKAGDLIVFRYPNDPDVIYAKRVGGVAGDMVVSAQGETVTVPEGSIFVIGDNALNSADSRHYGVVPIDLVVGQVKGVAYSWGAGGVRWERALMALR